MNCIFTEWDLVQVTKRRRLSDSLQLAEVVQKVSRQTHRTKFTTNQQDQRTFTRKMRILLDEMLKENDAMTTKQIRATLYHKFPDLNVSLVTVKWVRKKNGWVCICPHYCPPIREVNKLKRKEWCQQQIDNKESFSNVVFTDECTVQLDHHERLCFRKQQEARKLKQCPNHPAKVQLGVISPVRMLQEL